jgi:hypothetical protein
MIELLKITLVGLLVIFFEIWTARPSDTRGPYE